MIEVYEPPLTHNGRNISPFCLKLEAYCYLENIPFKRQYIVPNKAPRGQLPFMIDKGEKDSR